MDLDRWAERIYSESDFGRSVATSISGAIGLGVYLYLNDWVIAAFASVIAFPIVRIIATTIHSRFKLKHSSAMSEKEAKDIFLKLSEAEKQVLRKFVDSGGCVMSWSHANRVKLPEIPVASLMQRGLLFSTMTPDGMSEAFGVTTEIFDVAKSECESGNLF